MDGSDESAGANPPQSIDGESSHGRRKRGRPPSQPSTANDPKERKRKIDKESKLLSREVLEGFTKITPTLKELIQLVETCNLKELLQRIPNIEEVLERAREIIPALVELIQLVTSCNLVELLQRIPNTEDDAIERFKKVVPLLLQLVELGGQCNLGELPPNERQDLIQTIQQKKDLRMEMESLPQLVQDLTHSTQELKILIDGLKEVPSQIRECNTTAVMQNGQNFMQTAPGMVEQQNCQNFMQTAPGMVEQQNCQNFMQTAPGMVEQNFMQTAPGMVEQQNCQNFMQTAPGMVEQQNCQNFMQTAPGMVEQQNNENDATANFCNSFISDVPCGNGSNVDLFINSPSSSCYFEGVMSETSNQNGEGFDYEEVKTFFEHCKGNVKRQVNYADFNGLNEELDKGGRHDFPPFLSPIAEIIKAKCGDITKHSTQSNTAAESTCIMFYAAIKEMHELKGFEDISITKLRAWRDAILDALHIRFNVEFAMVYLMKIARAYFGSKPCDAKLHEREMSLKAQLEVTQDEIELYKKCQAETKSLSGEPLNASLFP
ncbi:hypothetical protein REPUB_Repub08aG0215600 [Reevesia pubescens]